MRADREKLIKLLCEANSKSVDAELFEDSSYAQQLEIEADFLIANGVTFAKDNNVPTKGHWIIHSSGRGSETTNWAECSECHVCGSPQWKVCPVCEAKMEVE